MPEASWIIAPVVEWYRTNARDLPWRRTTPWGVMVSEFMLQQTPVSRVLGPWHEWLERWPAPDDLAAEPPGAAVAAWGRLGYPRRALRLHQAAVAIGERHGGQVPDDLDALLALPGVGRYTAGAVLSFAFGGRAPVLDTNVRRVLVRALDGVEHPPPAPNGAEWRRAEELMPEAGAEAAEWAAASMELGALVCTARSPRCDECPLRGGCAWLAAGRPAHQGPPRRGQAWHGTDRQCRGALLEIVRQHERGIEVEVLLDGWHDRAQAERCVAGLLDDALVHRSGQLVHL